MAVMMGLSLPGCEEDKGGDFDTVELRRQLAQPGDAAQSWVPHYTVFRYRNAADSVGRDTVYGAASEVESDIPLPDLPVHRFTMDTLSLSTSPQSEPYRRWGYDLRAGGKIQLLGYAGQKENNVAQATKAYLQVLSISQDSLRAKFLTNDIQDNFSYYQVQYFAQ
jgi:hypothetical protein